MNLKEKNYEELQVLCREKDRDLLNSRILVALLFDLYSKAAVEPYSMDDLEHMVFNMIDTYQRYVDEESFECPF